MNRLFLVFLLVVTVPAYAEEPADVVAAALREARASIAAKDFGSATRRLEAVLDGTLAISNQVEREQALGALHFYAAVAYSGLRDEASARRHLTEFFRLSPTVNRIDPAKYDRRFVALFNELTPNRGAAADADTFELYYPVWTSAAGQLTKVHSDAATVEILGTSSEKRGHDRRPHLLCHQFAGGRPFTGM